MMNVILIALVGFTLCSIPYIFHLKRKNIRVQKENTRLREDNLSMAHTVTKVHDRLLIDHNSKDHYIIPLKHG